MIMKSTLENISIVTKNLTKLYTKEKGIKNINLTFTSGCLNLIIGKNGSGKSTLLKCIMRLVRYTGQVEKKKLNIGFAPENYIMPDYLTVDEFLVNIGRIKGLNNNSYKINSLDFFKMFNIENYRNKLIKTLSNGMKQKVNLIQALIHEPKILILDEPLIALDKESQKRLLEYLRLEARKRLIIISTHSPEKFNSRNKRIFMLDNGHSDAELS